MAGDPKIGPSPCPQYQVPVFNEDGSLNVAWYRFWAGLSGTVPGSSPVFPPVSFPEPNVSRDTLDEAIQALLPSPSIPLPDQTGAIQQALPSPTLPSVDQEARDLASAAFSRVPYPSAPPQIIVCTQATFPVLAGLSPTFVYVSDYSHMIFWDGSVAKFAGDQSGSLSLWENDPGTGYHIYDGSTVSQLNAAGTITSVTLPDLTSSGALAAFLEAGATNSGPTAAVAPTLSGNTADTAIGFTPASSAAAATVGGTVTINNPASGGTPVDVLIPPFSGGGGGGGGSLGTDPHHHAITGVTVSATAEPRKLVRRPYFRQ